MSEAGIIPSAVVDEAIAWSVKLNFGSPDPDTCAAFERWFRAAPAHESAWARMQALNADFHAVPQGLALDTLSAMGAAHSQRQLRRRAILKGMLVAGGVAGTGWAVHDHTPWQSVLADVRTSVGGTDRLRLADGTLLILNTDSAVDVQMQAAERVVVLYRGEISVDTGRDPASPSKRPFFVRTPFGAIQALGTRFVVRLGDDYAQVSVQQDAVALRPTDNTSTVVAQAGQTWQLRRQTAQQMSDPAMAADAWVAGAIEGKDMRLADLLAELARYRHGRITCSADIADIKVSGTYHVNDTDRALSFLAQTLPVRVRYWTRYWVVVQPA
ncbi:FecR domain-containing protein [Bordetella holmesii]|uniref:Sigma factor regulatory protein, FecR/PupR family n=2 Tax=Bordetella holmesii TaxID=35814 RepID=A0A158M8D5_9BORD|nr:FecR domain-containing protein [Bordetella holmesii]AHV94465.1 fecR family protein [Bordetella holmesii ATCC 51541]AIT25046.1 fecR family protein [Bordetella holmesii 44057]EWM45612.1 fecR family protein [Bordetella holmesii 70147]EWM48533.1 fecR family protein [Bordetella holmesii 41130]EWM49733.1 fecR family protein [Bordetella holmesii 35009]